VEFRWRYEATTACTETRMAAIRSRVNGVYIAHALVDEGVTPPRLIHIAEFLPPSAHTVRHFRRPAVVLGRFVLAA